MYFGLASNARTRETILVGGAGPGLVSYGDVWSFQYRSQQANEEDCANGEDDDLDQHADNQDPNCCAHDNPHTCLER